MVDVKKRTIICSHQVGRPQFFVNDAFHIEKFVSRIILSERIRRKA